jgi:hypothetical protein
MTLANVDGAPLGSHPLITRLVKGVFTKRPPTRKVPSVWDPVMDCFMHWSLPLSRAKLVRKCAFILAIASARQLSELFSLKCIGKHIQINDDFMQFVPSSLSKTDRACHFGPPIRLKAWKEDASICPVAITCALLTERVNLDIPHDCVFFDIHHPSSRRRDVPRVFLTVHPLVPSRCRYLGSSRFHARHRGVFLPWLRLVYDGYTPFRGLVVQYQFPLLLCIVVTGQ